MDFASPITRRERNTSEECRTGRMSWFAKLWALGTYIRMRWLFTFPRRDYTLCPGYNRRLGLIFNPFYTKQKGRLEHKLVWYQSASPELVT